MREIQWTCLNRFIQFSCNVLSDALACFPTYDISRYLRVTFLFSIRLFVLTTSAYCTCSTPPLSDAHVTWHCLKRRVHCGGEQMWCSIVPNIYLSLSAGYRTFCFNGKFIRRWNLSEASAQHWSNWLQYFSLIILLNIYWCWQFGRKLIRFRYM